MASAAILVGGRAERLGGRDKSAIQVDGTSMLERQLAVLGELSDDLLIVGSVGQPAQGGARQIEDRVPGCGPIGGLDAALRSARDHEILILACDMPYVTARFLAYLLAHAAGVDAVVPRTERGYHPLCGVYTRACQAVVEQRLAARKFAMLGVLDAVRVRTVERMEIEQFGEPDRLLTNVNTPDDLEALRRHDR